MEHSSASPSRAVSPRGNSNNSNNERKRKLESFVTESGETWEFERPVKKPRSSGPGFNASTSLGSIPPLSPPSPTSSKRSRDPSDDSDAQPPSPKRQMTSVTDSGDHAAVLRRNSWLSSSRKRRGAAASRSRSPSQSRLLGLFDAASGASQSAGPVESEVEMEDELLDYESDEEVTVGQHANNNLEQVALFRVPALTLPHASSFQEGQESEMPVVASIETDQDMKYQVGSSHHRAFETVVSGEYAVVAGNGAYEATSTARPVVWSSLDSRLASISRSPSPVTRYKLARADSSGSESDGDSPSPRLLRSTFGGFTQATAMVQHHSEAQQQLAREPGNTSTSSEVREVHGMAPPSSPAKELSPAAARSATTTPAALQPTIMDEPSQQLLSELQRYADENEAPSDQLFSELAKYADDCRNVRDFKVKQEEVKSQERLESEADVCAPTISSDADQRAFSPSNASPLQQINSAPTQTTFAHTEEEIIHMMAVYADREPKEADLEILRLCLEGLGDPMDIDGEDNSDLSKTTQVNGRDRIRKERDTVIEKTKQIRQARLHFQKHQRSIDEAPDAAPAPDAGPAFETDSDEDSDEYTVHLVASSTDQLQAERERLQVAWEYHSSPQPAFSTFSSEHWEQEARTCAVNEAEASNEAEQHYWSSRRIRARSYAQGKPGNISTPWVYLHLIDWNRSIAASEEEAAAFAEQVSQIQLGEDEDLEAPLRDKLALFLKELPPDLDQKVSEILNISNPGRAIVKSPEGNDLTRKDFATLLHSANYRTGEPEGWLNDEIINGFFTALCNAMNDKAGHTKGKVPPFASYISGWYSSVTKNGVDAIKRWSRRKGIMGDKLLQCKRIFFPVNPGNHWSLLVICPDNHTIEYLDSLDVGRSEENRKSSKYINLGRQWLQMELGDKYVDEEWNTVDRRSSIQNNGSDCGVFTCLNGFVSALELSNPTKEFGPEQIPYARRAMVSMFTLGGFNKHFEL
ncbi:cysteine proteinase [Aureobasidium pullulans]|nr:cysteine proteinase [Aureobasidium pullulans]